MSPAVDGSFAEQERASLQPLAPVLASILPHPLPAAAEWPKESAFSARERAELIARISLAQQNAVLAVTAFASDARDADEAGRKAAAWGIASTVTAAIIVAIVAVITSVFTFGSALGSAVSILAAQATALGIAAKNGHPLAGELAAILESIAGALRELARAPAQNRREAVLAVCNRRRAGARQPDAPTPSRGHDHGTMQWRPHCRVRDVPGPRCPARQVRRPARAGTEWPHGHPVCGVPCAHSSRGCHQRGTHARGTRFLSPAFAASWCRDRRGRRTTLHTAPHWADRT